MSDSDSQSSGSSYAESVSEDGEIERETRDKRNRSKTSLHSHRTNESTEYSSKHRSKQSLRYAKDEPEDYSDGDDYGDHEEEDSGVKPPQIKMKLHGVPDRGSSSKHRSGFGSEAGSTSRREGKSESRHRDREGSSSKHSDRPSTSRHRHHLERRETALESRREKKKRDDRGSRSTKFGERERDKTREQRVAGKESRSWMTLDDRDTSCVSDDERRRDRPGFISKSRYTSRHREASVTHAVTRKRSKTSRLISDKSPTYHGSAKDSSRSHFRASSSTTSNLQSTISSTVKDISKESSIKKIDPSIYVQEVEMSEEEKESSEHDDASPEASYPSNDVTTEDEDNDKTPSEVSPSRGSDEVEEAMKTDEDVPSNSSKDPDEMDQELGPIMGPPKPESMEIKEVDISNEEKVEPKQELPAYYPAIQGCRSVDEFERLNKIEEGTYGVVYRAEDKRTGGIVALKRVKMDKEKEGFPITSLREINTLLKAQHPNIVTVKEIVVGSNIDSIYIVMEYVEHDLKSLMSSMKRHFTIGEVKTLMVQLLSAVAHLHDNWILHRDLKTSNLLFSHKGILKVGDFGLAREYGSPLKAYTPVVVTLWYRAPELLLQSTEYSCPIDIWSVGCIFGEFLTMKPLFQGQSEIDQLNIIFETLGTPSEKIWPGYSELPLVKKIGFSEHPYNNLQKKLDQSLSAKGFDLINRFLTYCPEKRITAEEALKHEFFTEAPKPIDPSMFPTWPAKSEQMLGKGQKSKSPKPPSGGKLFSKQLAADDDEKLVGASGFHMGLPAQGKAAKGGFSLKF